MPFDPDQVHQRLSRLLRAASRLKREVGESATLDDATDRAEYYEHKAEQLYETYVYPLRDEDDLTDLEQRHLDRKETQMEGHAEKSERLWRDINDLTTNGAADMTTPIMEIEQTLKNERRRLSRYKQPA